MYSSEADLGGAGSCSWLVHLCLTTADAVAIEVELDVGMIGQQQHRDRAVGDSFGDHQSGEPLAKRIVMVAGVPDRDLLRLPGLRRADRDRARRDERDIAAAGGARILSDGQRVQI